MVTMRPTFDRVMRPASLSTSRLLHHRRQLDRKRLREVADRGRVLTFQPGQDRTSRRICERGECAVELLIIVYHMAKCWDGRIGCQSGGRLAAARPMAMTALPATGVSSHGGSTDIRHAIELP